MVKGKPRPKGDQNEQFEQFEGEVRVKQRKPPAPLFEEHRRRQLESDRQVQVWVKRLLADPDAKIADAPEDVVRYAMEAVMRRRGEEFAFNEYEEALLRTTPILSAP